MTIPNIPRVPGRITLDANVAQLVNALRTNSVIPVGDFGGPRLYYFSLIDNGLGNIIYTIFDRETTLGLASFTVRYGAASTVRNILLESYPRSQIDLQFLILPPTGIDLNGNVQPPGCVIP